MSRKRSFARGPAAYRRGKPKFQPSGKSFLIVTEGAKTEPNYLKALRNRLQLNAAEVEILHPDGTDPITLTNKAIELRDSRKKAAKKGLTIAYDEVWVVFDLEKPHDERRKLAVKAMAIPEAAGIRFAISDPAFEFWLLLHEEYTTSPFADCYEVIIRLEKHWAGYSKGQTPPLEFLEKMPIAVQHAQQCREHHETCAGDGNPSTKVDLLAKTLNSATRSHLQFKLA
jgi:hypothetical protein